VGWIGFKAHCRRMEAHALSPGSSKIMHWFHLLHRRFSWYFAPKAPKKLAPMQRSATDRQRNLLMARNTGTMCVTEDLYLCCDRFVLRTSSDLHELLLRVRSSRSWCWPLSVAFLLQFNSFSEQLAPTTSNYFTEHLIVVLHTTLSSAMTLVLMSDQIYTA